MELLEAIEKRHSVRSYESRRIEPETAEALEAFIGSCNKESGLSIQLVTDEPEAFGGRMAHYGKFSGVSNYIVLVGRKSAELDEKCGYYGEKIVLKAQTLGLNTCWVGLTYSKVKTAFEVKEGEKLCAVIAVGYGTSPGVARKSKKPEEVMKVAGGSAPEWFLKGIRAALLAPTAMNQQKFTFSLSGNEVSAKAGIGFFRKVDLGIVKCHFELAAGKAHFVWK